MFIKALATDAVKEAVEKGDVVLTDKVVTVSAKVLKAQGITADVVKAAGLSVDKDGNIEKACQIPEAQNARGMAALCGGKIPPAKPSPKKGEKDERTDADKAIGVCDVFNYAVDLDVRSEVRQGVMGSLESPDKAIKRAVDAMVAAGFPLEMAVTVVVAQQKEIGRVGADYEYKAA